MSGFIGNNYPLLKKRTVLKACRFRRFKAEKEKLEKEQSLPYPIEENLSLF